MNNKIGIGGPVLLIIFGYREMICAYNFRSSTVLVHLSVTCASAEAPWSSDKNEYLKIMNKITSPITVQSSVFPVFAKITEKNHVRKTMTNSSNIIVHPCIDLLHSIRVQISSLDCYDLHRPT